MMAPPCGKMGERVSGRAWRERENEELRSIRRVQRAESREALAGWLVGLRPWNARQTLTFSGTFNGKEWLPSEQAAVRRVQRYLDGLTRATGRTVFGVAGVEYGGKFGRIHAEVLLAINEPYRGVLHAASRTWEVLDGNGHVGRSRPVLGGGERRETVRYVTKYVTKGGLLVFSGNIGPLLLLGQEFADPALDGRRVVSSTP